MQQLSTLRAGSRRLTGGAQGVLIGGTGPAALQEAGCRTAPCVSSTQVICPVLVRANHRFCSALPCCRLVSCAVPFLLKMWLASAAALCSMSVLLLCCLACLDSAFVACVPVGMSDLFQSWNAVCDMRNMVDYCHELHHLPIGSPYAMHMHPLSHPVAMHPSIYLVC